MLTLMLSASEISAENRCDKSDWQQNATVLFVCCSGGR